MKAKLFIAAIALITFAGAASAQIAEESRIKILPSKAGTLKVHYAMAISEPVTVRFTNENGLITIDKIKGNYANGVMKRYDVSNIQDNDYWVEVSNGKVAVTYRVVPSKDKRTFATYLEKSTLNYPVVASNN